MDRLTLPLEVGKKYVRRDGSVVVALEFAYDGVYVREDGHERYLVGRKDGLKWVSGISHTDLVSDYVEQSKAHPHAASMLLYAQDAAEMAEPWTRWECLQAGFHGDADWRGVLESPAWDPRFKYRRKPKTIRIGEFDVLEPLRAAPERGQQVWGVHVSSDSLCYGMNWVPGDVSMTLLRNGMLHLTREAAEAHSGALIALSAAP